MAHLIEEWLQRRRWAVVAAALALITIVGLPPRRDVGDTLPESVPMSMWHLLLLGDHYSSGSGWFRTSLEGSRRRLLTRAAELRFADSASAEVARGRGLRTRDGSVALLYPAGFRADSARLLLALLEDELASYPPGSGHGAPVIVTVVPDLRAELGFGFERIRRFSVADERPACFVALEARRSPFPTVGGRGITLDWCALYARYGTPGSEIRAKLESRGPWLVEREHWLSEAMGRARARSWPATFWPDAFEGDACAAGSLSMCERLLKVPGVAVRLRQRSWQGFRFLQRGFLATLLVERGPERFEAFWRSRAGIPTAIEQAYGEPAGQLLHAWATRIVEPRSTGPAAVPWAQAAGIGWIAVAIGLAVLALTRQKVDG